MLRSLPGARIKRACLGWLGRRLSRLQASHAFPGNDWLAGISTPELIASPDFFVRWLRAMPGQAVELMCHPGELDRTLIGAIARRKMGYYSNVSTSCAGWVIRLFLMPSMTQVFVWCRQRNLSAETLHLRIMNVQR